MKCIYITLLISCLSAITVNSQSLHTPADLEQIIEKSKVTYRFDNRYKPQPQPKYPIIQRISNRNFEVRSDEFIEKNHRKAKRAIERKDFEKAEYYLTKASTADVSNMVIKQSLASVYVENEKYKLALRLYNQILSQNPFDYEVHQQIALCFQKVKDSTNALRHITLAHIYNRNHEEISATMKSIYLENGIYFLSWSLQPQYKILVNKDSTKVNISTPEGPWAAYAKCKAVWDFEEGYAQKMQYLSDQTIHIVEEKECLFNAIMAYERLEDKTPYPALKGLGTSLSLKMVDEYLLYEKVLPENPELVLNLHEEDIEKLIIYIQEVHTLKMIQ